MLEDPTQTELMALGKLAHLCGLSGVDTVALVGMLTKSAARLKILNDTQRQNLKDAGKAALFEESNEHGPELRVAAHILIQGQKRRQEAIEQEKALAAKEAKRRYRRRRKFPRRKA